MFRHVENWEFLTCVTPDTEQDADLFDEQISALFKCNDQHSAILTGPVELLRDESVGLHIEMSTLSIGRLLEISGTIRSVKNSDIHNLFRSCDILMNHVVTNDADYIEHEDPQTGLTVLKDPPE